MLVIAASVIANLGLAAFVVLMLGGVGYGYFTREGSGIDSHPNDGQDGAPGATGRTESTGRDEGEGSALATHGTR